MSESETFWKIYQKWVRGLNPGQATKRSPGFLNLDNLPWLMGRFHFEVRIELLKL